MALGSRWLGLYALALASAMLLATSSALGQQPPRRVLDAARAGCGRGEIELSQPSSDHAFRGVWVAVAYVRGARRACVAIVRESHASVETVGFGTVSAGWSERYAESSAPSVRAMFHAPHGETVVVLAEDQMAASGGGGEAIVLGVVRGGRLVTTRIGVLESARDVNDWIDSPCDGRGGVAMEALGLRVLRCSADGISTERWRQRPDGRFER